MRGFKDYDVIVVGVGSMGSAAVHTLAARGLSVLGLENFGPAHDQGSAHGGSRIIRQSYFEGPAYVPLLQRAFEGWRELQQESGRDLLTECGGIYIGDPGNPVVIGSRAAAELHGLPHEVLDAAGSGLGIPPCIRRTTPWACTNRTQGTCARKRRCSPEWTWRGGTARSCTSTSR